MSEMLERQRNSSEAMPVITSFKVLLCRVFWCFGGPIILSFLTYKIAYAKDGWGTPSDIAFPIIVAATIAARWIGFRNGERSNTIGEVTTLAQLRSYSVKFMTGGLIVWIAANVLANHVLN